MDTNSSAPRPMPERYNFQEIEPRWQQVWEELHVLAPSNVKSARTLVRVNCR